MFKNKYSLNTISRTNSKNGFISQLTCKDTNGYNQGLVVGVYQNNNGDYAYVVVNYSNPNDNKSVTVNLKTLFNNEYVLYGKSQQSVNLSSGGYNISLESGQGVLLAPKLKDPDKVFTVTYHLPDGNTLIDYVFDNATNYEVKSLPSNTKNIINPNQKIIFIALFLFSSKGDEYEIQHLKYNPI